MKKTIIIIIIITAKILQSENNIQEKYFIFKDTENFITEQKENEYYHMLLIPKERKCKTKNYASITFYSPDSQYSKIQDYIKINTKGVSFISKIKGNVKKTKSSDGREIYSFITESVEVIKPRTIDSKSIPIIKYHILVDTKEKKGFYAIFYKSCKEEENQIQESINKILKNIIFLK
ncbi:MAG: hypothetical protein N2Z20_03915 [Elusimicrobiales bacterium]|nr:hypothetical protein [Elusimicrobiales bacterium]